MISQGWSWIWGPFMSNGPFWEETLAGVDISLPRSRCRYLLLSTASIFQPPDAPDRAVAVGGCLDKVGWVVWRCCNCILNLIYHIIHINSSYSSLLLHFYNVLHVFILGNRGPASGLLHPAQKQLGYSHVPWSTATVVHTHETHDISWRWLWRWGWWYMMMDDPFRLELICHLFAKLSLTPGGLSLA